MIQLLVKCLSRRNRTSLAKHPSVSIAAVGKEEDKLKGEIAKAYEA